VRGDSLARLTAAFERHGTPVKGSSARCPLPEHDDHRPSVSITQGRTGVLLSCKACGPEATPRIVASLGLVMGDLFDEPRQRQQAGFQVTAVYPYEDEHGEVLFYVERRVPKDFRQYRVVNGRKVWKLGDTRRVIYRLPKVLAAATSDVIFVAEGEKDVHALENAGEIATTCPGGKGMGWRDHYSEPLAGRDVLVIADRDEAGRAHALKVAASVQHCARFVWIVSPAAGKDAHDHLSAGFGITDFTWWN
jgi:hypothetical protein